MPSLTDASFAAHTTPDTVVRSVDGRKLHVTLATGELVTLDAGALRAACRCAHCRRAQIDGTAPESFEAVTIESFSPIGLYAINIAFSDGHARGIFPWGYLSDLAAG